ncbi:MAG: type II toxin-antitoxin system VapC family toxin [Actinomycetota bacterium]|nr:type II toxin-antitoxin system VapC family toxin [Actinomycetota bacterium]
MSAVVIDASAGVEIVAETRRGRALARLVPAGSEGWVPEHFYAEVLGVLRRRFLIEAKLTESQATAAVSRLGSWHLHHASVAPLVPAAWRYRHNMTAADALYVTLAEDLGADFLTDDDRLAEAPTFPPGVNVLRLAVRS